MSQHHRPALTGGFFDTSPRPRALLGLVTVLVLAVTAVGCGGSGSGSDGRTLRLGYFANVTHAAAIAGMDRGFIPSALADVPVPVPDSDPATTRGVTVQPQIFNAGPATVESLFAGALDAAFVGPNPAINAFVKSKGEAIRIIAGATSGGAQLVVREDINTPQDLRRATLATPQLGNTQDVALRAWLTDNGLSNSLRGDGDVTVSPTPNANTLQLFRDGKIDGAWVPEPWASRMVLEAGGRVLLDERELWPDGQFVTTHLIVRTDFLTEHPAIVEALLRGHVEATQWINEHPDEAKAVVNDGLATRTGKPLPADVLDRGWQNMTVTIDPIARSLRESAEDAVAIGIVTDEVDLAGIYDLSIVNRIRTERGLPTVSSGGLGKE